MTAQHRPALRELAERLGILPEYVDQSGSERRTTSDETRVRLLQAMGFDAATEEGAEAARDRLDREERGRMLAPTRVVPLARLAGERVRLRIPDDAVSPVAWLLTLDAEDGASAALDGEAQPGDVLDLALPFAPEPGYHALRAAARWDGGDRSADQSLVVVPDQCWLPHDEERRPRMFGIVTNLYTVRGTHGRGVGNATDLRDLMTWAAELGADFVGVNPLHALWNRGTEISPYSPVTRLYRNVLYVDVERVPELDESKEARALLVRDDVQAEARALREGGTVEYERVARHKLPLLELLHRDFAARHRGRDTLRGRAYAEYLAEEGAPLIDHATFLALDEAMTAERGHPDWFRHWPSAYQSPNTSEVALFREAHAERVDFFTWLQFELDRQLGEAADAGRGAGMRIGLYQDLAIGSSGGGSDAWAFPHVLLHGVSIGAPPDLLGPQGQDWGLPPLDPRRLAEDGYRYWIQLLRNAFRHAGALRIDHVLGLFRQFWIPWGAGAKEGAYVRFPSEDLLGILALESVRHGAIVVGEDLGTVPPEVPPTLERWKVLGSRVLYFETEPDGAFRPAPHYPRYALATANTHDMAPLSGWVQGRELALRAEAGYVDAHDLERAREERARTVRRLRERLADEGVIASPAAELRDAELRGAVHAFLMRTPAMLVGVSLDDLAGETEPVNMPGLRPEEFASWTRRMRRTLAELRADPATRTALGDTDGRGHT